MAITMESIIDSYCDREELPCRCICRDSNACCSKCLCPSCNASSVSVCPDYVHAYINLDFKNPEPNCCVNCVKFRDCTCYCRAIDKALKTINGR